MSEVKGKTTLRLALDAVYSQIDKATPRVRREINGAMVNLVEEIGALEDERKGFLGREGRMAESWKTKSREELLEALEFQGATTRLLLKDEKALRARIRNFEMLAHQMARATTNEKIMELVEHAERIAGPESPFRGDGAAE
jgi:hypothetical protein